MKVLVEEGKSRTKKGKKGKEGQKILSSCKNKARPAIALGVPQPASIIKMLSNPWSVAQSRNVLNTQKSDG
jgi:hypothetical protein